MLSLPSSVTCGLCSGLCKRAVLVPCCKAIACRACAVKTVTQNHKCWNNKCGKVLTGSDIINNDALRVEIDSMGDGTILDCGLCKEICKRGIKLDCCEARACRACAIKEITSTRTCWACPTLGVTSDNMITDDLLRTAVDQFKNHNILLPDLRKQLTKKVEEQAASTNDSEATTSKVKSTLKIKETVKPAASPVKKKQAGKVVPKQKEKPAAVPKQNLPKPALSNKKVPAGVQNLLKNKKPQSYVHEIKTSAKVKKPESLLSIKVEKGKETSFFHRPLPELKPFVAPVKRVAAPPVAPAAQGRGAGGQGRGVKRQWASQFTRPVVDNTLLKKRMALDELRQKVLGGGPRAGQAFGGGAASGGSGQMGRGGMGRFGGGGGGDRVGFRGMGGGGFGEARAQDIFNRGYSARGRGGGGWSY